MKKLLLVLLFAGSSAAQADGEVGPKPWVLDQISKKWEASDFSVTKDLAIGAAVGVAIDVVIFGGYFLVKNYLTRSENALIGKINGSHFLKNFEKEMNSFCETYNCYQFSEECVLENVAKFQEVNNVATFKEALEGYMNLVSGLSPYSSPYYNTLFMNGYSCADMRAVSQFLDGPFYDLRNKCLAVAKQLQYARGLVGLYATQLLYEEAFKSMNGDNVDVLYLIDSMQSYKDLDHYQLQQFKKAPYLALVGMFETSIELVTTNDINNQEVVSKYPLAIAKLKKSLVQIKQLVKVVKRTEGYEKERLAFIASGRELVA
jgi:hypothetical protein